jgi:hypothetical protein
MIWLSLFLATFSLAAEKITISGQLQASIYNKLYYVYCEKGTRAIDREKALVLSREIANGEYRREDFLLFWGPTCSYEKSRSLAREASAGKVDAAFFALVVGKKCKLGHAIKPQEAELASREMASKSIDPKAYLERWTDSCRHIDSLRFARHDKIRRKQPREMKAGELAEPEEESIPVPMVH